MQNLFDKVMALNDDEFEKIENKEKALLKSLGAKKMHEFDNVGVKNNKYYALEKIKTGDDIILGGNIYAKSKNNADIGEIVII